MRLIRWMILVLSIIGLLFMYALEVKAAEFEEIGKIRCTCYTLKGFAANGDIPYQGMCAFKKEDIGKVAYLYTLNEDGTQGEYIGEFEIKDTGGKNVKAGKVIDIWRPDKAACDEFTDTYGDYVYLKIGESNGF